ncbi:MAG TPA: hypothetical protein ACFYD6_14730 [Candidatus Brocadiia bacterium]|nr:hypothetical protein [Candidatus Brocadiales bacterium]
MDAKKCNFDLLELKKIYSTASHEAIAYRMLRFSECVITIFDNGKVIVRKSSINNLRLGESTSGTTCRHIHPIEIKCFQKVNNNSEHFVVSGDNVRAQGWHVFKPVKSTGSPIGLVDEFAQHSGVNDWKRVILRTELDML